RDAARALPGAGVLPVQAPLSVLRHAATGDRRRGARGEADADLCGAGAIRLAHAAGDVDSATPARLLVRRRADRRHRPRAGAYALRVFPDARPCLRGSRLEMVLHTAPNLKSRILQGDWATIRDDYHWHIEVVVHPERANPVGGIYVNET